MNFRRTIPYLGNKLTLLSFIYEHFPLKCDHLVDVFGGSGTVTFNCKSAKQRTWNDANEDVFNFFFSLC